MPQSSNNPDIKFLKDMFPSLDWASGLFNIDQWVIDNIGNWDNEADADDQWWECYLNDGNTSEARDWFYIENTEAANPKYYISNVNISDSPYVRPGINDYSFTLNDSSDPKPLTQIFAEQLIPIAIRASAGAIVMFLDQFTPAILTEYIPDAVNGTPYSALVEFERKMLNDHTFEISAGPAWLTINPETGELTGTPGAGDVGSKITVTVKVSEAGGLFDSKAYSIDVNDVYVNYPPEITRFWLPNAYPGVPYTAQLEFIDRNAGDTHTFEIISGPSWLSIDDSDGTLSGTPATGDLGVSILVEIIITDSGGLSDQKHVILDVLEEGTQSTGPEISYAEYYFDTDPGYGSGTSIPIYQNSEVDFTFSADLSGISNGVHRLYTRLKDETGNWSLPSVHTFIKEPYPPTTVPMVTSAEYFIDDDPGIGQGMAIPVTPGHDIDHSFAAEINQVNNGVHQLNVRVLDEYGKWSLPSVHTFIKDTYPPTTVPMVTSAEYFIDDDPGIGQGVAISLIPGHEIDNSFAVDINQVNNGVHKLNVRVKDEYGKWSQLFSNVFIKDPTASDAVSPITLVEYHFENDSQSTPVQTYSTFTEAYEIDLLFPINVSGLTAGAAYDLHVKLEDALGRKSHDHIHSFTFGDIIYGTLSGTITDSQTDIGITGSVITVIPGDITANSDESGFFSIQIPAGINYQASVVKATYVSNTIEGITVPANSTIPLLFSLVSSGSYFVLPGDANGDDECNIFDVLAVVNYILGSDPTQVTNFEAADCFPDGGDGELNIFDILQIIDIILNPDSTPKIAQNSQLSNASVSITPSLLNNQNETIVTISSVCETDIAGAQFVIRFNSDKIIPGSLQLVDSSQHMKLSSSVTDDTITALVFSLEGESIQPGSDGIIQLPCRIIGVLEEGDIVIEKALFADGLNRPINVTINNSINPTDILNTPESFNLGQNHPNPFNPTTHIPYSVPHDGLVTMEIFNISGQHIKTLVENYKSRGTYTVVWNATDDTGKQVSGGIYLYRIKAGNLTSFKKMILLK
ncbi:putative Ig domain-containing protein [Candidatus Latescibacterota bacterium]